MRRDTKDVHVEKKAIWEHGEADQLQGKERRGLKKMKHTNALTLGLLAEL